jgi:NhaA family Na+:H+ antiporter
MKTLWRYIVDHFLLLPIGGLIALVWANTRPESYFTVAQGLAFPVNEIGMTLFFALMAQEIVEEAMPGGALHTWRKWTLPVVAALGAVGGAMLAYGAYVGVKDEPVLAAGWPAAAAIDLAFAYFVVRMIFGRRHPAVPFLILLAITVDIIALTAGSSRQAYVEVEPGGAMLMAMALGLAIVLRRSKAKTFWPYLLLCGPLAWWALHRDGFHPALALIPLVPFFPHAHRSLDLFTDAPHGAHDSPRHFEHVWEHPVQAVLFLFGLVNAGVLLTGYGTGTFALLIAAMVGKPLGIVAAIAVAAAAGLHLPSRLHWRDVAVVSLATSGVFTFGLFVATSIYPMGPILGELKIGAVAAGMGVPLAFGMAWLLGAGRFGRHRTHTPPIAHGHRPRVATVLVAVVIASGAAFAQEPPTDDEIRRAVREELADRDVDDVKVSVTRGAVTLQGTVRTLWLKEWAIRHTAAIDGVREVTSDLAIPRFESDAWLAAQVADHVRRYVFFSIFDDAEVEVSRGIVTLRGRATMPFKVHDFEDLASRVPGVQAIENEVRVLPASQSDDRLRYLLAVQLYNHPLFAHYSMQIDPPVHIIVERGAVTLTGIVFSEVERRTAEAISRMTVGVMSLTNKLDVEIGPD